MCVSDVGTYSRATVQRDAPFHCRISDRGAAVVSTATRGRRSPHRAPGPCRRRHGRTSRRHGRVALPRSPHLAAPNSRRDAGRQRWLRVICASGLKPCASKARLHVSHSPSAGLLSIASVTGVSRSSGFGLLGGGGIATPMVSPPPGPPAAAGSIITLKRAGSDGNSRVVAMTPFS